MLRTIVARCEGYLGWGGPLWEPERGRPLLRVEEARVRLLRIEGELAGIAERELRILNRALIAVTLFLVLFGLAAIVAGAPDLLALLFAVWLVPATHWALGRPLEIEGYWVGLWPMAAVGGSRLADYRTVLLELFDVWAGVPERALSTLRGLMNDAGANRVLLVVDSAMSLRSHRGHYAGRVEPAHQADAHEVEST